VKSILESFAYGEIRPLEGFFKWDSQYESVLDRVSEYEGKLMAMLNGEARELFVKFLEAQTEAGEAAGLDRFICGYRLGVLMMVEVFVGKGESYE